MRNILIISNKNNTKKMIQSNAVTRGELENELTNLGIDTQEMSFFEGFSRTELTDANSQLPQTVMYKGKETTDLIITLTPNSIKKVANGADMSRDELYRIIKEEGLGEEIYEEFGKRYQMVSTEALNGFIENYFIENDEEEELFNESHDNREDELINALNTAKNTLENLLNDVINPAIMRARPLYDDCGNLNIDELAKEFGK